MERARFTRRVFDSVARLVPSSLLSAVYRRLGAGLEVVVCLHRLGPARPADPYPDTTAETGEVDAFVRLAAEAQAAGGPRLWMSFDDGYADAAAYVASRAPWYREVGWLFFVCPQKILHGAGFRWDLYERLVSEGTALPPLVHFVAADVDPASENHRPDLIETGKNPAYALATEAQCRELQRLPNVALGNHTDTHLPLTALSPAQAAAELDASRRGFEQAFGPLRHFAFPFGRAGVHYSAEHLEHLTDVVCFSTEDGLFEPRDRRPGSVLPRIIFRGSFSGKAMLLWVAWCAVKRRLGLQASTLPMPAPVRPPVTPDVESTRAS